MDLHGGEEARMDDHRVGGARIDPDSGGGAGIEIIMVGVELE
jgi:hypothetical protein